MKFVKVNLSAIAIMIHQMDSIPMVKIWNKMTKTEKDLVIKIKGAKPYWIK